MSLYNTPTRNKHIDRHIQPLTLYVHIVPPPFPMLKCVAVLLWSLMMVDVTTCGTNIYSLYNSKKNDFELSVNITKKESPFITPMNHIKLASNSNKTVFDILVDRNPFKAYVCNYHVYDNRTFSTTREQTPLPFSDTTHNATKSLLYLSCSPTVLIPFGDASRWA